jgi:hypothetical protein
MDYSGLFFSPNNPMPRAPADCQAFLSIGTNNLAPIISQIPSITPVTIDRHTAEYYFTNTVDGQIITFPIELIKENGMWKISNF